MGTLGPVTSDTINFMPLYFSIKNNYVGRSMVIPWMRLGMTILTDHSKLHFNTVSPLTFVPKKKKQIIQAKNAK